MSTARHDRDELLARTRVAEARLALAASFHADALSAALDLRRTDIDCLMVLRLDGPATPGQLGDATGLSSGGVSGVLDRLERAGFVRRESDPGDRRRVVVSVAPEGVQQVDRLLEPLDRQLVDSLESVSTPAIQALLAHHEREVATLNAATSRLRAARAADGTLEALDGVYTVPAGARNGTLEFSGASGAFSLRGDASVAGLLTARLEGPVAVRERDGTVTFASRAAAAEAGGEIILNPTVPWRVRVRGGAVRIAAALEAIRLEEVAVSGGAADLECTLGRPTETVRIRVTGGDSRVALIRPAGVPARVRVGGGLADLELDGERRRGRSGLDWTTPGFDPAAPHLDIAVRGGMTHVTLAAHQGVSRDGPGVAR